MNMPKFRPNYLVLITFIVLGLFFARSIAPSADTFWHLAVGRQVWQEKKIPTHDKFIYGPKDKSFNSVEWLSALIFYLTVKSFSLKGLVLLRVVIGLASLYFIYRALSLVTQNDLIKVLTLAVTGYVFAYRLYDRPEIFSFLFLAFVNYICFYYLIKKSLPKTAHLLPVIFLAWPNIHPFTILGLMVLISYLTSIIIMKFILKDQIANIANFAVITLISFALVLVQYHKFFIFLEFNKFASHKVAEFYGLWQKATVTAGYDFFNQLSWDIYIYLIVVLLYFVLIALHLFKYNKADKFHLILNLSYLTFLLLPLKLYRLWPAIAIIVAPQLLLLLKSTDIFLPKHQRALWAFFMAVILILTVSIANQRIAGIRDYQVVIYETSSNGQTRPVSVINNVYNKIFPEKAADVINNHLASKRIFTSTSWNNYFLWRVPNTQVFADALFYNRTDQDYTEEGSLAHGGDNWQDLINKFNIDTVINSQSGSVWPNDTQVYKLDDWKLVWIDSNSIVYAKKNVIKSTPVDLSAIQPDLQTPLKFKSANETLAIQQLENMAQFDPVNSFAQAQLARYYFEKDFAKAQKIAQEARMKIPNDPIFSLTLSAIYAQQNNCSLAKDFGEETINKSFGDYDLKKEVTAILAKCQSQTSQPQ